VRVLLCRIVGHRWAWEGRPGDDGHGRLCAGCGRRRPAWRTSPVAAPAAG